MNTELKRGYQVKTVRRILRKKISKWLESLPDELAETLAPQVIVTGGACASMLIGEEVNDYDIYFKTKYAAELAAHHYVRQFTEEHPKLEIEPEVRISEEGRVSIYIKSAGAVGDSSEDHQYECFENNPSESAAEDFLNSIEQDKSDGDKKPYRPRYLSENAISLSDKVQIVIRFYGEPEAIHANYDFEHCKCWYDYQSDTLGTPPAALLSLMSRTLSYTGSLYPLCSLFRMRKFVARGWNISAGEILKMGFQVSELDLRGPQVLRDQLVGVDMAYFHELLRVMDEEKESRDGKPVDSTYICQLVDRIFNT